MDPQDVCLRTENSSPSYHKSLEHRVRSMSQPMQLSRGRPIPTSISTRQWATATRWRLGGRGAGRMGLDDIASTPQKPDVDGCFQRRT